MDYYILDRTTSPPREVAVDFRTWGEWMESSFSNEPAEAEERMKRTRLVARDRVGDLTVSTVFLSLNYNWSGRGAPILYETMIFRGDWNADTCEALDYEWRWRTWDEATVGHQQVLTMLDNGLLPDAFLPSRGVEAPE